MIISGRKEVGPLLKVARSALRSKNGIKRARVETVTIREHDNTSYTVHVRFISGIYYYSVAVRKDIVTGYIEAI